LKSIENKLKSIENKLKSIESNLKSIENKLKSIESKLKSIENKLKSIENKLKSIENKLKSIIFFDSTLFRLRSLEISSLLSYPEFFEGGTPHTNQDPTLIIINKQRKSPC
jgi:archaellum component FlaC